MKNALMYVATAAIWGSTWLGITFQLGHADPLVSIALRFFLAAGLLFGWCFLRREPMGYSLKQHLWVLLQAFFLFYINYWLVYLAEISVPSGLMAVLMSGILFLNMFNGALFLRQPLERYVMLGALVGIGGMILLFKDEVFHFSTHREEALGLVIGAFGVVAASWGNILSARNQKAGLPILQTNAYGMLYGAVFSLLTALLLGRSLEVDWTLSYTLALFYLAIFGSVVAFGCYLSLIGRIGVSRSAYIMLISPVVALGLSTLFEGYLWTLSAVLGVGLILLGNSLILRRKAG